MLYARARPPPDKERASFECLEGEIHAGAQAAETLHWLGYGGARGRAYSPPFAVRYAAPADTVPGGCDGRDTGVGADSHLLSRSPVRSNR